MVDEIRYVEIGGQRLGPFTNDEDARLAVNRHMFFAISEGCCPHTSRALDQVTARCSGCTCAGRWSLTMENGGGVTWDRVDWPTSFTQPV